MVNHTSGHVVLLERYASERLRSRPSSRAPVLVIWEFDEIPYDLLGSIHLLLHLEHEMVKLLLQLLVGVVDQKLLEMVVLERLESEVIERTRRSINR